MFKAVSNSGIYLWKTSNMYAWCTLKRIFWGFSNLCLVTADTSLSEFFLAGAHFVENCQIVNVKISFRFYCMFMHSNKFIFRHFVKIWGHHLSTKKVFNLSIQQLLKHVNFFSWTLLWIFGSRKKNTFGIACFCSGEWKIGS